MNELYKSICKELESVVNKVFVNSDPPTDNPLFTIEDEEKIITSKIKSIDKDGNVICEQIVKYKEPITKLYIKGEVKE